ncbi:aminopeptidase [Rhizoctonia solani]|uniref:Peptide hydrolase n=1 Tax=Rhizoctonia solani TaxID=456999 RepID=A0A8H7M5G7_9AGAM|nr:aminopeptidase [Rhizoctonia solani]
MTRFVSLAVHIAAYLAPHICATLADDASRLPLTSEALQNANIWINLRRQHAKALQSFADSGGGTRVFGLKGHNASVDYVAAIAEQAGYDVQRQTFPHVYFEVLTQRFAAGYSTSTPVGGITAPLVLIPDPDAAPSAGCTPADFAGVDVKGKIALIQRGACDFAVKDKNAKDAGAVGVVVYNNVPDSLLGSLLVSNDSAYIPIGSISQAEGESLARQLVAGQSINATLEILVLSEQRYSSNVIATSKAGNQSNVIFIGSHLDSVSAGPGINDNGSGSITVLELAVQLAKYKLKNAVRFAWWTVEEYGIVEIALYINLDMVASPNYVLAVYDGDGSAGINPGPTPAGSGAIEKVFTDYFASKNLSSVPTSFNGRSDYAPFIAAGVNIPSGGLFTGAEGIKTEEQARLFGGTAGVAYDVNYHAKGDTYDNLNFEAFLINAKASAHAMATFIESTAAVEAEKAAARASSKVAAKIITAPNDSLVVQGKDLCGVGEPA